jgi:hypothetical protein
MTEAIAATAPPTARAHPSEYVNRDAGVVCPACGGTDLHTGDLRLDDTGAQADMECENCGARWLDGYTLTGYHDLRDKDGVELAEPCCDPTLPGTFVWLSEAECSTVLAALRMWQSRWTADVAREDIASNSGTLEPLDPDSIDALCERINN